MAIITGTSGTDRLVGTADADTIDGLGGNDLLIGQAGADTLNGGEGDDRLDGGLGADAMTGGIGGDAYVVDDAGDTVSELAGEGGDTVTASVTWTLGAGIAVERLIAGGALAVDLTGNELSRWTTIRLSSPATWTSPRSTMPRSSQSRPSR